MATDGITITGITIIITGITEETTAITDITAAATATAITQEAHRAIIHEGHQEGMNRGIQETGPLHQVVLRKTEEAQILKAATRCLAVPPAIPGAMVMTGGPLETTLITGTSEIAQEMVILVMPEIVVLHLIAGTADPLRTLATIPVAGIAVLR